MSGFLTGVASRISSVMKAAALLGLEAAVGEELGDGRSSCPQACRRGEETTGAVPLFSLEVLMPFNCGFDCECPFVAGSLMLGALVLEAAEGPVVVGSADD
jgi:hypothetical protein